MCIIIDLFIMQKLNLHIFLAMTSNNFGRSFINFANFCGENTPSRLNYLISMCIEYKWQDYFFRRLMNVLTRLDTFVFFVTSVLTLPFIAHLPSAGEPGC